MGPGQCTAAGTNSFTRHYLIIKGCGTGSIVLPFFLKACHRHTDALSIMTCGALSCHMCVCRPHSTLVHGWQCCSSCVPRMTLGPGRLMEVIVACGSGVGHSYGSAVGFVDVSGGGVVHHGAPVTPDQRPRRSLAMWPPCGSGQQPGNVARGANPQARCTPCSRGLRHGARLAAEARVCLTRTPCQTIHHRYHARQGGACSHTH